MEIAHERCFARTHATPVSETKLKLIGKRRQQYAALPVQLTREGQIKVLLLTSRGTGRWVIPKGWPMPELLPAAAAAREAFEEAGVEGTMNGQESLGSYRYAKGLKSGRRVDVQVTVFLLVVENELDAWPEQAERERRWCDREEAANLVAQPELAAIIRNLDAARLMPA